MRRYLTVWLHLAKLAAISQLLTNWSGMLFIVGKVARFVFYFLFLFTILGGVTQMAGYSRDGVVFFFLFFTLIDSIGQFLFRGVYIFRGMVLSGNFDLDLLKPLPSFFRPMFGWTDILDLVTIVPLSAYLIFFSLQQHLITTPLNALLGLFLFINAVLLAFSFHLIICAICVLALEIDHLIMIYRDVSAMARFPTDIYPPVIRFVLTFIIPFVLMVTVPVKTIIAGADYDWLVVAFLFGLFSLIISLRLWSYALKKYSSASS